MLKLSYDLHIHSCLSPCGDKDMTPMNIVNMAKLKKLDIIAVTDHNSCRNCLPVLKAAEENGIIAIPGMELCTMEEVHVLCFFMEPEAALSFDEYVSKKLIKLPNEERIFGAQEVYDEMDHCIGKEPYLLINVADISFDELGKLMKEYNGVYIPAHIDRSSNSLLSNLGFVPLGSDFSCVELKDLKRFKELCIKNPYLSSCRIIMNSDAHFLGDINEPIHYLQMRERSREAVVELLKQYK